jgi:soluble cytochrome b562
LKTALEAVKDLAKGVPRTAAKQASAQNRASLCDAHNTKERKMNDEAKDIKKAEEFVQGIMDNCPEKLRDIDVIAACGFLVSAYASDPRHAANLITHIVHHIHEYCRKLENGELEEQKVH